MSKGENKKDSIYDELNAIVLEALEQGKVPWLSPYVEGGRDVGCPLRYQAGKEYKGINRVVLGLTALIRGYTSAYWCTFREMVKNGASFKEGEGRGAGVPIVKYLIKEKEKEKEGAKREESLVEASDETETIFCGARRFVVFNCGLMEGFTSGPLAEQTEEEEEGEIRVKLNVVAGGPDWRELYEKLKALCPCEVVVGDFAYARYIPATDRICVPSEVTDWGELCLMFAHEMIHATGHSSRLNRFGSEGVAEDGELFKNKEEAVAEIGACGLAIKLGFAKALEGSLLKNSQAYLQHWIDVIEDDRRALAVCVARADKAVSWLSNKVEERALEEERVVELSGEEYAWGGLSDEVRVEAEGLMRDMFGGGETALAKWHGAGVSARAEVARRFYVYGDLLEKWRERGFCETLLEEAFLDARADGKTEVVEMVRTDESLEVLRNLYGSRLEKYVKEKDGETFRLVVPNAMVRERLESVLGTVPDVDYEMRVFDVGDVYIPRRHERFVVRDGPVVLVGQSVPDSAVRFLEEQGVECGVGEGLKM